MPGRTACFAESVSIFAPLRSVYAILSDPTRMVGMQPLLLRCEVVSQKIDPSGKTADYEVYFIERFEILGPIGYDNRIQAFHHANLDESLITFAVRSFPNIRLFSRYVLSEKGPETVVELSVTVKSPALLCSIVKKPRTRRIAGSSRT